MLTTVQMSNATISTWGFIVAWNHAWNHTLTIADFLIYPDVRYAVIAVGY